MAMMKRNRFRCGGQILYIPTSLIRENPLRPRIYYNSEYLDELCASVERLGILEPLTVVYDPSDHYTVISGEMRLRAARRLSLTEVPCILTEMKGLTASLASLADNTRRRALSYFETALTLERIRDLYALDLQTLSAETGFSLQEIQSKLRLLSIPAALRKKVLEAGLTERFAQLLVRHSDEDRQKLFDQIVSRRLTLSEAKKRSDQLLKKTEPSPRVVVCRFRDGTVFVNTIDHAIAELQVSGVPSECSRQEDDESVRYEIRIAK